MTEPGLTVLSLYSATTSSLLYSVTRRVTSNTGLVSTCDHLLYVLLRDALLAAQDLPELVLLDLSRVVRIKQPQHLRQGVLVQLRPPLDGDQPEVLVNRHVSMC